MANQRNPTRTVEHDSTGRFAFHRAVPPLPGKQQLSAAANFLGGSAGR